METRDDQDHPQEAIRNQAMMGQTTDKVEEMVVGPSWRPAQPAPIDPQVVIFAEAIGLALAGSGKRQANEPLPFKNHKHQNVKLSLLQ